MTFDWLLFISQLAGVNYFGKKELTRIEEIAIKTMKLLDSKIQIAAANTLCIVARIWMGAIQWGTKRSPIQLGENARRVPVAFNHQQAKYQKCLPTPPFPPPPLRPSISPPVFWPFSLKVEGTFQPLYGLIAYYIHGSFIHVARW